MSTRVAINIALGRTTRLYAHVFLWAGSDWIEERAIVDTGAPFCVIPSELWKKMDPGAFAATGNATIPIAGKPREGFFATLEIAIGDAENTSQAVMIGAFFCADGDGPMLLGMQDIFTDVAALVVDIPGQSAYIEFA